MSEHGNLICVGPDMAGRTWPLVSAMVEAAYSEVDEPMPDDMPARISDGRALLWIFVRADAILAALVTSLSRKPSGLACRMVSCGGSELELWRRCEADIANYARAEGCVKIIAEGRRGWSRVLGNDYEVTRVTLEKRI